MTKDEKAGYSIISDELLQSAPIQMLRQREPWATVDTDGTVSVLDIDAAREVSKDSTVGVMERGFACIVVAAYEKGLAEGAAGVGRTPA